MGARHLITGMGDSILEFQFMLNGFVQFQVHISRFLDAHSIGIDSGAERGT